MISEVHIMHTFTFDEINIFNSDNNELIKLWQQVVKELISTTSDHHHPWRSPVLCTQSAHGPRGRTIILRDFIDTDFSLIFHTDQRSTKYKELKEDPRAEFVFYNPNSQHQLRVKGNIEPCATHYISRELEKLSNRHQNLYCLSIAPSTPITQPSQAWIFETADQSKNNFTAFQLKPIQIESLQLGIPHQRASFTITATSIQAQWLAP